MTKNCVYVVCATADNHIAEMAAISMHTLRRTNPGMRITVLLDRATSELGNPGMQVVRELCDHLEVVDTPFPDPLRASRYLKVHMRACVEGDFVYLDSDTVMLRAIDELWSVRAPVAAVSDCIDLSPGSRADQRISGEYAKAGWPYPVPRYLNSGVILMRDVPEARRIGSCWAECWQAGLQQGVRGDQLSFNHVLATEGIEVAELPERFNAQVVMNPHSARNAAIVHVFTGNFDESDETVLHVLAKRLRLEGAVDSAAIDTLIASRNPWTRLDSIAKCRAVGNYSAAVPLLARKLFARA